VNLDFECANLSDYSPVTGFPTSDAIPGWTAYIGTTELTAIGYDVLTLGDPNVSVVDANFFNGSGLIQGQYSLMLQPGDNQEFQYTSASISQTGLVPVGSESLLFDAEVGTPFTVSLGGNSLALSVLGTSVNSAGEQITQYGANIANYAGQTEALTVTALAAQNSTDIFDAFAFSAISVPEPDSFGLFALGALCAVLPGWRKGSQ